MAHCKAVCFAIAALILVTAFTTGAEGRKLLGRDRIADKVDKMMDMDASRLAAIINDASAMHLSTAAAHTPARNWDRMLISRMEQRAATAALSSQSRIYAAVAGDLTVAEATAPNRVAAQLHSDVAARMLIADNEGSSSSSSSSDDNGVVRQVQTSGIEGTGSSSSSSDDDVAVRVLAEERDLAIAFGKQLDASERIMHAADGDKLVSEAASIRA